MKNKMIIILITIVLLNVITGCENVKKNKHQKENKENPIMNYEKNVIKNQNIEGIDITNTSLVIEKNTSKLETKITNNTNSDYKLENFEIIVKDENNKEIIIIPEYVGVEIKKGESIITNVVVDVDLKSAKSIEYKVKK